MFIKSVMPSNHLILCRPLLLLSIFASIKVFSNESVLHIRWPKYWRFSFSISPSNEYSGLISFRIYWFDLLTVQGILKSCHINVHLKNLSKLVNFCVAILILKMEGKSNILRCIISRKVKIQQKCKKKKKRFVQCMEKVWRSVWRSD